ncbi:MAG: ABC transporter substrate-binding protein [Deltaproteobacteria bacterium]|nr:ABC transporter substrate-binding protein [Deltaproteobacteria bacterium]
MISKRLERERPRMVEKKIEFHRIVSLAAFLTETLYAIGAGDRVAGVTDSCDFPDEVKEKPNVSSWFEPDLEKLIALSPDLVVGMETAHQAIRSTLESEGIQVILVNPATVEEALDVILAMGEAAVLPGLMQRLNPFLLWSVPLFPGCSTLKTTGLSSPDRYRSNTTSSPGPEVAMCPVTSKKLTQKYLSNGFVDGIPMWSFSVVMTGISYPGFVQIKNGDLSRLFDPGGYTNSTAR